MREFHPPVSPSLRQRLIDLVQSILACAPNVKQHYGRDLMMATADTVVSRSTRIDLGEDVGTMSVGLSEPAARPPFEWIAEITAEVNETDYLRHYLIRDNDVVLAHRKVLTEIDDAEAQDLADDLAETLAFLQQTGR